jgi:hypothetical protein
MFDASKEKPTVGSARERQKKELRRLLELKMLALYSTKSDTSMKTSSKPRRSHRAFQEKDVKKAYSSFEAFLNGVKSSPRTMTRSGHVRFASVMSWSL